MKQVIAVIIWTLLFISLGIYSENKINDFTDKFKTDIEVIENYIEEDKLDEASNNIKDLSKSWHEEKEIWYKIVNHEYFDEICLSINILEKSIKYYMLWEFYPCPHSFQLQE